MPLKKNLQRAILRTGGSIRRFVLLHYDVEIEQIPQISNRRTVRRSVWIARLIFRIWRADADAARVRALAAYKDFLALWKDADPDIPILKQAKAEYAKLQ